MLSKGLASATAVIFFESAIVFEFARFLMSFLVNCSFFVYIYARGLRTKRHIKANECAIATNEIIYAIKSLTLTCWPVFLCIFNLWMIMVVRETMMMMMMMCVYINVFVCRAPTHRRTHANFKNIIRFYYNLPVIIISLLSFSLAYLLACLLEIGATMLLLLLLLQAAYTYLIRSLILSHVLSFFYSSCHYIAFPL